MDKIKRILTSIDKVERATVPAFFYTRVKARMENVQAAGNTAFAWRPALLAAGLALVCTLNIIQLVTRNDHNNAPVINNEAGIESFAREYNLTNDGIILQ